MKGIYVLALCLITLLIAATGPERGGVTGNDGPKAPAVYYLVGGNAQALEKEVVVVAQENKQFAPSLVSVSVGSTVQFPNKDEAMHNVYSPKGVLGFFDMGSATTTLADSSNVLSKTMDKEGVVEIACAIHPIMQGAVFVVPSRYHTTSRDGTYTLSDVPAGTYDLMVMTQEGAASKLKTLTVE